MFTHRPDVRRSVTSKLDLKEHIAGGQQAQSGRSRPAAMKFAIGGQFEAHGQIEADMLRFFRPRRSVDAD